MNLYRSLAIGLLAVAIAAPASAAEKLKVVITETVTPLVPNSVQILAKNLGYFDKAGVDVDLVRVQQTPSAVAALTSGDGDMANVSVDAVLQLVARGQMKAKAVISPDKAIPFMIASKDTLKTAKDMEGKTFGVSRIGSLDHTLSLMVMKKLGLNVDKVELVNVGEPSVRALALASGKVDSTSMSIGVWSSMKDKTGLHILVPQNVYFDAAPLLSKVNIVTAETATKKKAAIAGFVKGIMMASRDFHKDPKIWVDAMAKERSDVPRATLELLGEAYKNSWSANGGLNLQAIGFTTDSIFQGQDFKELKKPAPTDWVDTSFADTLIKQMGKTDGIDDPGR